MIVFEAVIGLVYIHEYFNWSYPFVEKTIPKVIFYLYMHFP